MAIFNYAWSADIFVRSAANTALQANKNVRAPSVIEDCCIVNPTPSKFYARWRVESGLVPAWREGEPFPPERLLQAVWQHQRLLRDRLRTLDGQPVRVLHPGFRNLEAGPDFRGAVVQIGDAPARSGAVEVDLRAHGWQAHGHDTNPAFREVILHAVWEAGGQPRAPLPTLSLHDVLDAPLAELHTWLGTEAAAALPESARGHCSAPLRDLPTDEVAALLRQAAQVRLQGKAAELAARARQAGWEQALWEGLFRALGYKNNVWPMLRLAELRPRWQPDAPDALALQARLLGLGGLLPAELTRAERGTDLYLRRVWDHWWRERDAFAEDVLPRELWRFANLRPANHPQRRLALASHWLAEGHLPARLEQWLAAGDVGANPEATLLAALPRAADEFWSWHWTLRSPRLPKLQPLVGGQRVTDLGINVVLPWLWARAAEAGGGQMQQQVERRYFAWPAAEDNARLKLARQRLLGGAHRQALKTAAAQQGLMQILRDFCDNSNAVCDACKFPQLVRDWQAAGAGCAD